MPLKKRLTFLVQGVSSATTGVSVRMKASASNSISARLEKAAI